MHEPPLGRPGPERRRPHSARPAHPYSVEFLRSPHRAPERRRAVALDASQVVDAASHPADLAGLGGTSPCAAWPESWASDPGRSTRTHRPTSRSCSAVLAQRVGHPARDPRGPPAHAADNDAAALLLVARFRSRGARVRDGADVVSVAHALDPLGMQPVPLLITALTDRALTPEDAGAVLTLTRFALGCHWRRPADPASRWTSPPPPWTPSSRRACARSWRSGVVVGRARRGPASWTL
ncbi:hypothetical protein QJS66_16740 [Kocuria rhizophila]|nr:hypothetical protein QJS66_16740 [Kocuria rhizophila]